MQEPETRNLLLALLATMAVLFVWQVLWVEPQRAPQQSSPGAPPPPPLEIPSRLSERPQETPRLPIDTPRVHGSVALRGAALDDLSLKDYRQSTQPNAPLVHLLTPVEDGKAYVVDLGWRSRDVPPPSEDTLWRQDGTGSLTPDNPIVLVHESPQGLVFRRTIAVDENYMFTITQDVENRSSQPVRLQAWARISRQGALPSAHYSERLVHQGLIGVFQEEGLEEIPFAKLKKEQTYNSHTGWLGISTKYWATILIPEQNQGFRARFSVQQDHALYEAEYTTPTTTLDPGQTHRNTTRLFAGAKVLSLVKTYQETQEIPRFDLLIDWGWFFFLTRPMFALLFFLFQWTGDFGMAILLATVLIRVCLLPLTMKSMFAMHKMSLLQPQMKALQDRFKDEPQRLNQEIFALYRKEGINPLSGCLPVLPQIPIFFALYRVLLTTIEMRHVAFWGWIEDLSAADPTSVFNLFGLLAWEPPYLLQVGAWPVLMGLSMFLLMRLNPRAKGGTEQMQMIYKLHPVICIGVAYLISGLPAGLVIYMTWSNCLSMLQTLVVRMRYPGASGVA